MQLTEDMTMEFSEEDIKIEEVSIADDGEFSDSTSVTSGEEQPHNMIFTQIYIPKGGAMQEFLASSAPSEMNFKNRPGRKQKLEHLTFEEKLLRKKLKNREAAQTSRDRKKARMTELEMQVRYLQHQNERLQCEKESVCKENERLKQELTKPADPSPPTNVHNITLPHPARCSQNATHPHKLVKERVTPRVERESAADSRLDAKCDSRRGRVAGVCSELETGDCVAGVHSGHPSTGRDDVSWSEAEDWDWLLDLEAGPTPVSVQQLEQLTASLLESAVADHCQGAEAGTRDLGAGSVRLEPSELPARQRAPISPLHPIPALSSLRPAILPSLSGHSPRGHHEEEADPFVKPTSPTPRVMNCQTSKPTTIYKKIVPKAKQGPKALPCGAPVVDPTLTIISRVSNTAQVYPYLSTIEKPLLLPQPLRNNSATTLRQRLEKYRHSNARLVPHGSRTTKVKTIGDKCQRVRLTGDHDYFKPDSELSYNGDENVLLDVKIEDAVEEVVTSHSELEMLDRNTIDNVVMNRTRTNSKEEAITAIVDDLERLESSPSELTSLYENSTKLLGIRDDFDDDFGPVIDPVEFFDLRFPTEDVDLRILPDMSLDVKPDTNMIALNEDLIVSSKNSTCSDDKGYESIDSPFSESSINELMSDAFLFPDLSLELC